MTTVAPQAPAHRPRSNPGTRSQRIALVVILLLCAVTRVGWVLHIRDTDPAATTSLDTPSYVQPARALAEDGRLSLRPGSTDPIYLRTPGYPGLMGIVLAAHESETLFLVVQALLSCLTVLLAYLIAARLWNPRVGLVAAAIIAVEPLQFAAAGTLLSESLSSLSMLCIVGAGFRVFDSGAPRRKWCLLLGLAVAIATLIRPTTYYLPIVVIVLLAIAVRSSGIKQVATAIAMFLVPVIVLIGGWQVRNHYEVGSWRYSGVESKNLFHYRAADALARSEGIGTKTAIQQLDRELSASPTAKCGPERCSPADPSRPGPYYDELSRRGIDVLTSHPAAAIEGAARGLGREVFGLGTDTVGRYLDVRSSTPLKLVLGAGLACFYLALAFGLVLVIRKPDGAGWGHIFAIATTVYVLVVSAGPEAYARFRGPVMPILALYAALGIATAWSRVRPRWAVSPHQ